MIQCQFICAQCCIHWVNSFGRGILVYLYQPLVLSYDSIAHSIIQKRIIRIYYIFAINFFSKTLRCFIQRFITLIYFFYIKSFILAFAGSKHKVSIVHSFCLQVSKAYCMTAFWSTIGVLVTVKNPILSHAS